MTATAPSVSGQTKSCWKCGAAFICGPEDGNARCWCDAMPAIAPRLDGSDCLCRSCLIAETQSPSSVAQAQSRPPNAAPQTALATGEDYYQDGASIVFTAAYHRRRGYCCENGCRHCPYR